MSTIADINTGVSIASGILIAAAPALGPASAVVEAIAPELPALALAIEALAAQSGTDQRTAAKALLAQATALDPGSLVAREDAADAAHRAELAAAKTRVSVADVAVGRRLATGVTLTSEERASVARLADHAALTVGG